MGHAATRPYSFKCILFCKFKYRKHAEIIKTQQPGISWKLCGLTIQSSSVLSYCENMHDALKNMQQLKKSCNIPFLFTWWCYPPPPLSNSQKHNCASRSLFSVFPPQLPEIKSADGSVAPRCWRETSPLIGCWFPVRDWDLFSSCLGWCCCCRLWWCHSGAAQWSADKQALSIFFLVL